MAVVDLGERVALAKDAEDQQQARSVDPLKPDREAAGVGRQSASRARATMARPSLMSPPVTLSGATQRTTLWAGPARCDRRDLAGNIRVVRRATERPRVNPPPTTEPVTDNHMPLTSGGEGLGSKADATREAQAMSGIKVRLIGNGPR